MLEDRVYGIRETLFHDPYYQRHVVGLPVVRRVDGDGTIEAKPITRCFAPSCGAQHRVQRRPLSRRRRAHAAGLKFASRW